MPSSAPRVITAAARASAVLVAVAVAAFAVYLLVVGMRWTVVSEESATPRVEYRSYPLALVPLAAAALVLLGLWWRWQPVAWAGVLFLALIGGLTIWSVGLPFLGAAVVLVPLLLLIHVFRR